MSLPSIPIPNSSRRLSSSEVASLWTHGGSRGSFIVSSPLAKRVEECLEETPVAADWQYEERLHGVVNEVSPLLGSKCDTSVSSGLSSEFEYYTDESHEVELLPHKKDTTTIHHELRVVLRLALPLVVTFLLQNLFSVASIFSVGHLGKKELAGITLGLMTANITGYAAIQGLSTCLDTLCCQAFGARKYHLVGVYLQRCVAMILTFFVPVVLFWFFAAEHVLQYILPSTELGGDGAELARLAANYLKVVSIGIPGYVFFECGKRFLQAQGVFDALTYILLFCAPVNILLNYILVWNEVVGIGFLGAPLSVVIVNWLMALGLFAYCVANRHPSNVMKAWGGLDIPLAFRHWDRLVHLALNGLVMVEAEFLAFEVLTVYLLYLGIIALDANSVVSLITALTYQVPFAVSIAGSTRLANYVGAGLPNCLRICARSSLILGAGAALFNCSTVYFFRRPISRLFTSDEEVIVEAVEILKIIAVIQIFDAMNSVTAGLLRGEGMQHIGSITNLTSYYLVGLPLAYFLTFTMGMGLQGLWIGMGVGLCCIFLVQLLFNLILVDWDGVVGQASKIREREGC